MPLSDHIVGGRGQRQLVDLSRVTDRDEDVEGLIAPQARTAEAFLAGERQGLMARLAPTP